MARLTPIQVINSTTDQWFVDPLPTNLTVINGTLSNGTIILGHVYMGGEINGTTVIERLQSSQVGSMDLVPFINLLMSLVVFIFVVGICKKWVRVAFGYSQYHYTDRLLPTAPGALTAREFDRQLRVFYRLRSPDMPTPSYPETRKKHPREEFSPEGLRDFRALVRAKYAMDVQIWNYTGGNVLNQPILDEWKTRSHGATVEMMETIARWKESQGEWSPEEWEYVQQISSGIQQLDEQERTRYGIIESTRQDGNGHIVPELH